MPGKQHSFVGRWQHRQGNGDAEGDAQRLHWRAKDRRRGRRHGGGSWCRVVGWLAAGWRRCGGSAKCSGCQSGREGVH